MRVYVGMDVHRKCSQVAVLDDAGVPSATATFPTIRRSWCRSLAPLRPGTPVAFEAAYGWGWLVELLEELELEPHLVHPSRRRGHRRGQAQERQGRCSDFGAAAPRRPAARGLDRAQQVRDLRALLRHRASLVRLSTTAKHRIHAVLADRGIQQQTGLWTGTGRVWLAELPLPPTPRAIVQDYLALLDGLAEPIARLERQIHALAKPDPRVQALMVLPGVGNSPP